MTHEEKAREIVEFYIGDCACEIERALASAEKKGRELELHRVLEICSRFEGVEIVDTVRRHIKEEFRNGKV